MSNTFEAECQECGAIFDYSFENIGQKAQCPSCSALIELVPKIEVKDKDLTQVSGGRIGLLNGLLALALVSGGKGKLLLNGGEWENCKDL